MDKFSYAIGLGIGQNLLSMGAKGIAVDDFAQAIKDVLEGNQTAISHTEARDIVNKYFAELEEKMNAANIEAGKKFLEENKKREGVVRFPADFNTKLSQKETSVTMPKQPTRYNATTKAHWLTERCSTAPSSAASLPHSV